MLTSPRFPDRVMLSLFFSPLPWIQCPLHGIFFYSLSSPIYPSKFISRKFPMTPTSWLGITPILQYFALISVTEPISLLCTPLFTCQCRLLSLELVMSGTISYFSLHSQHRTWKMLLKLSLSFTYRYSFTYSPNPGLCFY